MSSVVFKEVISIVRRPRGRLTATAVDLDFDVGPLSMILTALKPAVHAVLNITVSPVSGHGKLKG